MYPSSPAQFGFTNGLDGAACVLLLISQNSLATMQKNALSGTRDNVLLEWGT